jgi:hypothetical protein
MKAPLALASVLSALISTSETRAASPYAWNAVDNGELIQFSHPDMDDGTDTGDRLLRIDCDDQGHIYIGGPFASGAANGDTNGEANSVTFESEAFHEARVAEMVTVGDTTEFSAAVDEHDPAIQALLKGQSLTVRHAGRRWTVPGRGAQTMLRRLLDICRTELK